MMLWSDPRSTLIQHLLNVLVTFGHVLFTCFVVRRYGFVILEFCISVFVGNVNQVSPGSVVADMSKISVFAVEVSCDYYYVMSSHNLLYEFC